MNTAIVAGIVILLVALIVFIFRLIVNGNRRKKAEIKMLREEIKELKETIDNAGK